MEDNSKEANTGWEEQRPKNILALAFRTFPLVGVLDLRTLLNYFGLAICFYFYFYFFTFLSRQHCVWFPYFRNGPTDHRLRPGAFFFLKSWLLLGLSSQVSKFLACPSVCRDRNFVYCNERSLTSVPSWDPGGATVLYLHNNQINNAGFPAELQRLSLCTPPTFTATNWTNSPWNSPQERPWFPPPAGKQHSDHFTGVSGPAPEAGRAAPGWQLHLHRGREDGAFREALSLGLLFLSKNHLSSVPVGLPRGPAGAACGWEPHRHHLRHGLPEPHKLGATDRGRNLLTNKGIAEGTFSHLTKLKEFSIVRNSLPPASPDLPGTHLVRLYLQDNQINHPFDSLLQPPEAGTADISNNQLRMLTQGVFGPSLQPEAHRSEQTLGSGTAALNGSRRSQTHPRPRSTYEVSCAKVPEQVRGMAVRELNMNLLSCPTTTPGLPPLTPAPTSASPRLQPTTFSVPIPSRSYTPLSPTASKLPHNSRLGWQRKGDPTAFSERIQLYPFREWHPSKSAGSLSSLWWLS